MAGIGQVKSWAKLAAAAALAAVPAAGMAETCWLTDAAAAAAVRDLQSVLMVGALQCRLSGQDVLAPYNAFVNARRAEITRANDRLKAQFVLAAGAGGMAEAQVRYDRFTTSLANAYGAAAADAKACGRLALLARVASSVGSAEGLAALGALQGLNPALPVEGCPAGASVPSVPRATLTLAAAPPPGMVVTLVAFSAPAPTTLASAVIPAPPGH